MKPNRPKSKYSLACGLVIFLLSATLLLNGQKSSSTPGFQGNFTVAKAMEAIWGNYDLKDEHSDWDNMAAPKRLEGWKNERMEL